MTEMYTVIGTNWISGVALQNAEAVGPVYSIEQAEKIAQEMSDLGMEGVEIVQAMTVTYWTKERKAQIKKFKEKSTAKPVEEPKAKKPRKKKAKKVEVAPCMADCGGEQDQFGTCTTCGYNDAATDGIGDAELVERQS